MRKRGSRNNGLIIALLTIAGSVFFVMVATVIIGNNIFIRAFTPPYYFPMAPIITTAPAVPLLPTYFGYQTSRPPAAQPAQTKPTPKVLVNSIFYEKENNPLIAMSDVQKYTYLTQDVITREDVEAVGFKIKFKIINLKPTFLSVPVPRTLKLHVLRIISYEAFKRVPDITDINDYITLTPDYTLRGITINNNGESPEQEIDVKLYHGAGKPVTSEDLTDNFNVPEFNKYRIFVKMDDEFAGDAGRDASMVFYFPGLKNPPKLDPGQQEVFNSDPKF